MAKQLVRTRTVDKHSLSFFDGLVTARWEQPDNGMSVKEIHSVTDPVAFGKAPGVMDLVRPPPHWHWYQDEYFHIRKGRYHFTLDGKELVVSANDPQPVHIPARAFHTFWADTTYADGPCEIQISGVASPNAPKGKADEAGISERFFRNLYTYMADCHSQGVAPSLPQLLIFLNSAEVSLALPGPAWLARPVSYALGVVVGEWIGKGLLGLKASYPEYWDDEKSR